jgi:hypothetical protein
MSTKTTPEDGRGLLLGVYRHPFHVHVPHLEIDLERPFAHAAKKPPGAPVVQGLDDELKEAAKRLLQQIPVPSRYRPISAVRPFDPDLRKYASRLYEAVRELQRLLDGGRLKTSEQKRLRPLLTELQDLDRGVARALHHQMQLLIVEAGDEEAICTLIEGEQQWPKSSTSWLTWEKMYGSDPPKLLEAYRDGRVVSEQELEGARHELLALYHERFEDELVQRSRGDFRTRLLNNLALFLVFLLTAFLAAAWFAVDDPPSVAAGLVIPLAGALGAAVAGTIKARDTLTREAGVKSFSQALITQMLLGATAAVALYALLRAFPVTVSGIKFDFNTLAEKAALGFIAGFSEPVLLKTVERVTNLIVQEPEADKSSDSGQTSAGGN